MLSNSLALPFLIPLLLVLRSKLILRNISPQLIVLAAKEHVPMLLPLLSRAFHSSILLL
jgi:hypothetical protein